MLDAYEERRVRKLEEEVKELREMLKNSVKEVHHHYYHTYPQPVIPQYPLPYYITTTGDKCVS